MTEPKNPIRAHQARKSLTTFPFKKSASACNCGKYNLQNIPQLQKILPSDYDYKLCDYIALDSNDQFLVTLRMSLTCKEEALEWKHQFEEKSLTTHVLDKSFPKVGRVSVFKVQYRCQFFDRRKAKNKLQAPEKSKFRDCHSILFINIKKFFKNTIDQHMPKYCTVVRLHFAHSHSLDTADVLRKRGLNPDIRQRFLEMYQHGTKPKDALDTHKKELLQKLGPEKYRQVVCDGYYVPNLAKAYRLYYQFHGKGVSAKTSSKRSSKHNPSADWLAFQACPGLASVADDDNDKDVTGRDSPDSARQGEVEDNDDNFDDTFKDDDIEKRKGAYLGTDRKGREMAEEILSGGGIAPDVSEVYREQAEDARSSSCGDAATQGSQSIPLSSLGSVSLHTSSVNYDSTTSGSNAHQKTVDEPGTQCSDRGQAPPFEPANTSVTFSGTYSGFTHIGTETQFPSGATNHHVLMNVRNVASGEVSSSFHPPNQSYICETSVTTWPLAGSAFFTPNQPFSWGTLSNAIQNQPEVLSTLAITTTTINTTSSTNGSSLPQHHPVHPIQTPKLIHQPPSLSQLLQNNRPSQNLGSQIITPSSLHCTHSGTCQSSAQHYTPIITSQIQGPNGPFSPSSYETHALTTSMSTVPCISPSTASCHIPSFVTITTGSSNQYPLHYNCQHLQNHQTISTNNGTSRKMLTSSSDETWSKSTLILSNQPSLSQSTASACKLPETVCTTTSVMSSISPANRATVIPSKRPDKRKARDSVRRQKPKPKSKPSKELNIKLVTKRWIDQKPRVDAETQSLASELMGTILLRDKAEKLKVRLFSFLSGLESKITSDPKLFVPALEKFLQAGESAKGDSELAVLLTDFGRTAESLGQERSRRGEEIASTRSTQTQFSRCSMRRDKNNFISGAKAGSLGKARRVNLTQKTSRKMKAVK